ncbi:hypothetical protein HanPSC8_Chr14g0598741 [Helianthus annuus]|nr:hypothetical protein HanPSC8_Chr14g0598741 [Helianthus annuus]
MQGCHAQHFLGFCEMAKTQKNKATAHHLGLLKGTFTSHVLHVNCLWDHFSSYEELNGTLDLWF